jgi:hypothetical protein
MPNRAQASLNGHAHGHAAPAFTTAGNGDRDAGGRSAAGNRAAVGNPFNRRCARLRGLLMDAVTDDDVRAIARRLVGAARRGDTAAAKLFFAYLMGKPTAAPDPDLLDRQEWQLAQEGPDLLLAMNWFSRLTFGEALARLANMHSTVTPLGPGPGERALANEPGNAPHDGS